MLTIYLEQNLMSLIQICTRDLSGPASVPLEDELRINDQTCHKSFPFLKTETSSQPQKNVIYFVTRLFIIFNFTLDNI